jgi:hypothetical protein
MSSTAPSPGGGMPVGSSHRIDGTSIRASSLLETEPTVCQIDGVLQETFQTPPASAH